MIEVCRWWKGERHFSFSSVCLIMPLLVSLVKCVISHVPGVSFGISVETNGSKTVYNSLYIICNVITKTLSNLCIACVLLAYYC